MSNIPHLPPASDTNFSSIAWQKFFRAIVDKVAIAGQILWTQLSFAGSNITDILTRNHDDLQNLNTTTHTHLSAANATSLIGGGDTTLHYHLADRAGITTFEYYANNIGAHNVTSTTYTAGVSLVKVFDLGGGLSLTSTLSFSAGLPTTKVLSGDLPAGLTITTKTYNFSGGHTVPLITYS